VRLMHLSAPIQAKCTCKHEKSPANLTCSISDRFHPDGRLAKIYSTLTSYVTFPELLSSLNSIGALGGNPPLFSQRPFQTTTRNVRGPQADPYSHMAWLASKHQAEV